MGPFEAIGKIFDTASGVLNAVDECVNGSMVEGIKTEGVIGEIRTHNLLRHVDNAEKRAQAIARLTALNGKNTKK